MLATVSFVFGILLATIVLVIVRRQEPEVVGVAPKPTTLGWCTLAFGSQATAQYHSPLHEQFNSLETCPEKYLLWFHHVPWDHRMQSGRTLWEELQHRYNEGVAFVEDMVRTWQGVQPYIDPQRHAHVNERLTRQLENARLWREVCIDYFGQFIGGEGV